MQSGVGGKTAYTEVTSGRKPEVSTDCSLALFSFCNHVTKPQNLSQSGACMPSNRTTTDVHGSPFLHVLLIQRLHRYKAMMKPSKRPRFRLTNNMLCTSAVLSHGKHACSWKSSAKIFWRPGSSNKSGFHTVYNGVRCGWSRVFMWSAAAALVSSHTLCYCRKQEPHALTFTLSVRTVKLDKVPALSLQWTSATFCAQTGSVTGTGIVNTGTRQSHATGPGGTAETATVVTMTAEIDHADMTGTIGMHQSLLPIDHSADICKFSCLCHSHTASWPRSPHEHRHRHRNDRWQMHLQRPADLSGKTVKGDPACCAKAFSVCLLSLQAHMQTSSVVEA